MKGRGEERTKYRGEGEGILRGGKEGKKGEKKKKIPVGSVATRLEISSIFLVSIYNTGTKHIPVYFFSLLYIPEL